MAPTALALLCALLSAMARHAALAQPTVPTFSVAGGFGSADLDVPLTDITVKAAAAARWCQITLQGAPGQPGSLVNAFINCAQGNTTSPPTTVYGSTPVSAFAKSFQGVNYVEDRSLPAGAVALRDGAFVLRNTEFSSLVLPVGSTAPLVLSNVTAVLLNCNFTGNSAGRAGAVSVEGGSRVRIFQSLFVGNSGGDSGAIHVPSGKNVLGMNGTTLLSNNGTYGGGLLAENGTVVSAINLYAYNNTATYGGAAYLKAAVAFLVNWQVRENLAAQDGGGLFLQAPGATSLVAAALQANTALGNGGGIAAAGCTAPVYAPFLSLVSNFAQLAGGGLYATGCSLVVNSGQVVANRALGNGGGASLALSAPGATSFNATRFADNQAVNGGAAFVAGSRGQLAITVSELDSNTASALGGGLHLSGTNASLVRLLAFNNTARQGGGAYVVAPLGLQISNSAFDNNTASAGGGGGLQLLNCSRGASLQLVDFVGNVAGSSNTSDGGGLAVQSCNTSVADSGFVSNAASGRGGGIAARNSTLTVANSNFDGNSARAGGGGVSSRNCQDGSQIADSGFAANVAPSGENVLGEGCALPLVRTRTDGTVSRGPVAVASLG